MKLNKFFIYCIFLILIVNTASATISESYNPETKTKVITNTELNNTLTIKEISIQPGITTFIEELEITTSNDYQWNYLTWLEELENIVSPIPKKDFNISIIIYKGNESVNNIKWYEKNISEWKEFNYNSSGIMLAGTHIYKIVLTKQVETGSFSILTVPKFMNIEIPEMTWWNYSAANGGIVTEAGGYRIHKFLSNGTFVSNKSMNIEYLIVAGGGQGGNYAGGGGAGGVKFGTMSTAFANYSVIVGRGGSKTGRQNGENGTNSSFGLESGGTEGISLFTSIGGGGGGSDVGTPDYGNDGGSGGGAAMGVTNYGKGISPQGKNGGTGAVSVVSASGGGGGYASAGGNGQGTPPISGNGGDGYVSSISGISTTYATGGGGGSQSAGGGGTVGQGGSSNIHNNQGSIETVGGNPPANTGSGGGGGGWDGLLGYHDGGNGASGIVIIRYLISEDVSINSTISSWSNNNTNNQITEFHLTQYYIKFNITTNIISDKTVWTVNNINQSNNYDNLSYFFSTPSIIYYINVTVSNNSFGGIFDYKNWIVEFNTPFTPMLSNINTGLFYANQSWISTDLGITDLYNVSVNDIWFNGSFLSYKNTSLSGYGWINTSIYAFNTTLGYINPLPLTINTLLSNLTLITPINTSLETSSTVTLSWYENPANIPYTYQISSDINFFNIIVTGTTNINSSIISLNSNTQYYWHVKNSTGLYTNWYTFTTPLFQNIPGKLNITVLDETNFTLIKTYTIKIYNTTSFLSKSTIDGYVNFSGDEVSDGEYLIIAIPNSSYFQRMILSSGLSNVTMYLPPMINTSTTIDLVVFSLLDITGIYPFLTSTITILKSGLVMDKAYFSIDGTHAIYLIQGDNYQIQIQNGNNIWSKNYIPYATGTFQITINDFMPNATASNPFVYNIPYSETLITLNWNDAGNVMDTLNFTVRNQTSMLTVCQQTTSINAGSINCDINNFSTYYVIFSALMNDGTYRNSSFVIDYTSGKIKHQDGRPNPIDGSIMGKGYYMATGTFIMPDWVLTWCSFLLFIILLGSFGAAYSGLGSIFAGIILFGFEYVGWFAPIGEGTNQNILMGLTGFLILLSFLYYMQHRERGG